MGVDLGDILCRSPATMKELSGRMVAVDAFNTLYQFLSIIRQPNGTPLMDGRGRVTSHLSGILYRVTSLIESGARVAFVFDGKPPEEKRSTINDRLAIRDNAQANWEEALSAGQDGFKYAIGATKVNEEIISDAKRLLSDMGIPVVFAPSEGEAQAAYIASRGDADYVASQDYDSVLFGAPVVIRNLAISGRRKLPKKNIYVDVSPETITLKEELDRLGISRKQLVEIGVLCGTDYNEGISRIGPKTALKLIKEHGDIESVLKARKESADTIRFLQLVRELFMHPNVSDEYDLRPGRPKPDRIISFLCQERDFSVDRVTKAVERLESASKAGQSTLDRWF